MRQIVVQVNHPMLLLNAPGASGNLGSPPVLPWEYAMETAGLLTNGKYITMPANHLTMILRENAKKVVEEITSFLEE